MPYRRRTNYRRRPYRRNYQRKGRLATARKMTGTEPKSTVDKIAQGVGTVATIAKTVSGIVSMINVEDKFVDTAISAAVTNAAPYAVTLNAIAQGSDYNQRNGNKVLDKCLQCNLRVFLDASATALATQMMRIVILIDKKPQIGALTFGTVYTPSTSVAGFINKNTVGDRIVVLKDMKLVLNGGNNRYFYRKFYCSLSRLHTQWTGSTATAFESGQIYLLAITDVTGASPAVLLDGNARFCYMDN